MLNKIFLLALVFVSLIDGGVDSKPVYNNSPIHINETKPILRSSPIIQKKVSLEQCKWFLNYVIFIKNKI